MLAFFNDERGVAAIEYSLIAALVTVGAIASMDRFGQSLEDNLYDIIEAISNSL
jgi:Flp pilus assembly pilin Flp